MQYLRSKPRKFHNQRNKILFGQGTIATCKFQSMNAIQKNVYSNVNETEYRVTCHILTFYTKKTFRNTK